jgi:sulfite exporter TauE/SafE
MWQSLIEGWGLGLATGMVCLATCTPIYLPYLLSNDNKPGKSFLAVLEISLGRFFTYLAFGAVAGFLGKNIAEVNRHLFTSIAYILLSLYLILTAVRTHQKEKKCHIPKMAQVTSSAFVLGILTGVNFCPSFLIALSKAVNLGGVLQGTTLFFGFFLGTTLYLIPMGFVGFFHKVKELKLIGRIASVLIALWFLVSGIRGVYGHVAGPGFEAQRLIDVFKPGQQLVVLASADNSDYFGQLKSALIKEQEVVRYREFTTQDADSLALPAGGIFFVDATLMQDAAFAQQIAQYDHFVVPAGYDLHSMIPWLKRFVFNSPEPFSWVFEPK